MHPEIIQDTPGNCPKCGMTLVKAESPANISTPETKESAVRPKADLLQHELQKYTCPMHPHILRDGPGKCPICGMNLEPVAGGAHRAVNHSGMIADFRRRFIVVLILTIPIMLLSEMIQQWLNFKISFPGSKYVLLALSSVVYFYGGWTFV